MLIDSRLELSDAQALTASADSTNVIDLVTVRQVGAGKPLFIQYVIDVAAGGTSPTFQINIATGSATTLGTVIAERILLEADAVAGAKFQIGVPTDALERYLGIEYVLGGTSPTITISAWLTDQELTDTTAYADAI